MASAAQLTVTTDEVSAGTQTVASCDTDGVNVEYTASFVAGSGEHQVSAVSITGIDAGCSGLTVDVALLDGSAFDGSDAVLDSGSATADASGSVSISGLSVSAEDLEGVAVAIF